MNAKEKHPVKITLGLLRAMGACEEQQREFHRIYPRGGVVNVFNVRHAMAAGLAIRWLVQWGMNRQQRAGYDLSVSNLTYAYRSWDPKPDSYWAAYAELNMKYILRSIKRFNDRVSDD